MVGATLMQVIFADILDSEMGSLDESVQKAIFDFASHVERHGFKGLKGRNKSSAIESTTKKGMARFKTAQKHCLWHESGNSKALLCPLARQELCSQ